MNKIPSHALVTGGSGYIGRHLVRRLLGDGWFVTLIGRQNIDFDDPKLRFFPWSIGAPIPDEAFKSTGAFGSIECLFHLAHDRTNLPPSEPDINISATASLLLAAKKYEIKDFIFASSVAASPNALNYFGRVKSAAMEIVLNKNRKVAKIGLVYGGEHLGLWGTLVRLVKLTPILPMVSPGSLVQPIHISEVCEGLIRIATKDDASQNTYVLAASEPISFGEFLKVISLNLFNRPLFILPIPLGLALFAASSINAILFGPRVDKERILGLAGLGTLHSESDLQKLGLDLQRLEDGLKKR